MHILYECIHSVAVTNSQNKNLFVTNVQMSHFALSVNYERDDVYINNVT